jgi:hypothetical protein
MIMKTCGHDSDAMTGHYRWYREGFNVGDHVRLCFRSWQRPGGRVKLPLILLKE